MYILNIETSTTVCSIAISDNENLVSEKISFEPNSHSKLLAGFIDKIFEESGISINSLSAISVSEGPGSYTGLRIGVSTAKGLAYALKIPIIAIDTLKIIANEIVTNHKHLIDSNTLICPMIDARRAEVFTCMFDSNLEKKITTKNIILQSETFFTVLEKTKVIFCGDGALKTKEIIKNSNAIFLENIFPLAKNMIDLSFTKFQKQIFEDTAYFEPFYLKEFVATTPKDKLL